MVLLVGVLVGLVPLLLNSRCLHLLSLPLWWWRQMVMVVSVLVTVVSAVTMVTK